MKAKLGLSAAVTAVAAVCLILGAVTPAAAVSNSYISVLDPNGNPPTSSSAMVIGISGGSTANRGQAILFRWQGDTNQRWTTRGGFGSRGSSPLYEIVNAKSNKCLDKSLDVPDADGNAVYQFDCTGASNQLWYQASDSHSTGGWKELRNNSDDRCLDITGPSYSNGAILHVWHCYGNWSQQWNID